MDNAESRKKPSKKVVVTASAIVCGLVVLAILSMTHVIAIKPGGLSDVAWKAGRQAYAIAEDYDSGRISTSEAAERLSSIDTSYGTMDTGDLTTNANNAHVATCVQKLASDAKRQELHEKSGVAGLNDMHQVMRDDMAKLAGAIGYSH